MYEIRFVIIFLIHNYRYNYLGMQIDKMLLYVPSSFRNLKIYLLK